MGEVVVGNGGTFARGVGVWVRGVGVLGVVCVFLGGGGGAVGLGVGWVCFLRRAWVL